MPDNGIPQPDYSSPHVGQKIDLAAPLPKTDELATVEASTIVDAVEMILSSVATCASRAANADAYSVQQYASAAEHLARALDVVADLGRR